MSTQDAVSTPGALGRVVAGRYELRRERGRGPRAVVYEAHDKVLDRPVVIKEFLADALDAARLKLQEAEVRRVAHLEHPSLTRLFDAGIERGIDGRPFIFLVADYRDGRDLRDEVAESPLSETAVAQLGHGLSEALATIHGAGLAHGNVTPSNILCRHGEQNAIEGTLTDLEVGYLMTTPETGPPPHARPRVPETFMVAPEVLTDGQLTAAGDLYALGMCLAFALLGEAPSRGEDGVLRLPLGVARPLGEALRAMTDRDPAGRPTALAASLALFEASTLGTATGTIGVVGTRDRREAARDLEILARAPDEFFDRVARIAASLVGAPIALLSLVSHDVVTYRGAAGIDLPEDAPIAGSLCARTALYAQPWTMADIWSDPRARGTVPVVGPDLATAFAAAPLLTHAGASLGALSVYTPEAGEFSERHLSDLVELALIAMRELELSSTARRSRDVTH